MNDLLNLALDAHGGSYRWSQSNSLCAHLLVDGILLSAKGQPGLIRNSHIELALREQQGRYIDFDNKPGQDAHFVPDRMALTYNQEITEILKDPRQSFKDHIFETPWSPLQTAYFGIYAMWQYLTVPFHCTLPGFQTKEIERWHEAGETWRRLHVTYPETLAYHTREQIYFFDEKGLLKRIDYEVDINEYVTSAHYVFDYKDFQGIRLPTRHLVYPRDDQGHYIREPVVVRYDLLDLTFS